MGIKSLLSNPWVKHLLKAGFSVGLVLYLVHSVNISGIQESLEKTSWTGILIATVIGFAGVVYLQAMEIYTSMRRESRIPVWSLCKINLVLMFYVLFLPAGITFVIRWKKYQQAGYGGYDSAALVGFHKILQLAVACFFSVGSLLLLGDALGKYENELLWVSLVSFAVLAGGLIFVLCGHTGMLRSLPENFGLHIQPEATRLRHRVSNKLLTIYGKALAALDAFSSLDTKDVMLVILFGLLQHLFLVLSGWVLVAMVVPDVSFAAVMLIRSLVVILLMAPISVGGLGVRELAFYTLFPLFGVAAASALSASLLLFVVQLIISAMGGAVELLDFMKPKKPARG